MARAIRVVDPFEVMCSRTKVLNSISFEKDSSGRTPVRKEQSRVEGWCTFRKASVVRCLQQTSRI